MTEMRILTVRQPWAWAIIHGGKDVENRVRNIAGSYRGPVAIHAGLQHDHEHDRRLIAEAVGRWSRANHGVPSVDFPDDPRNARPLWYGNLGRIIGVVDLVGAHFDWGQESELCSEWTQAEVWHLVLANPRPLAAPIPYRGALGLRRLPDDVADRIRGEL